MRAMIVVGGIAVLALAGGCTSGGDDPAPEPGPSTVAGSPPPWTEPANYSYTAERQCEGKTSMGIYEITVAGGEVTARKRTDGKTAAGEEEIDLPTLGGLLELAQTASDDGGQMSVSSDAGDGHPTAVAFDVSEGQDNADNTCFVISQYSPS